VVDARVLDAPEATRREVTLAGRLAPGTFFLQISQGATSDPLPVTIVC
jgi:hypothetical protein